MKTLVWPLVALASAAFLLIIYLSSGFNPAKVEINDHVARTNNHPAALQEMTTQIDPSDISINTLQTQLQHAIERVSSLENEVFLLRNRVSDFEERAYNTTTTKNTLSSIDTLRPAGTHDPGNSISDFDKSLLLKAGVSDVIATDIMLRYNHAEMQKLELRDDAIRSDYLNTPQYYRELREIDDGFEMLHKDIGDSAYDQVLFATGRDNRVSVASVIPESPADLAGILQNDIIIKYSDKAVFNPVGLKTSTSQGQRNEYVNVTVLRDGELLTLLLPRGPLGIRLGTVRIKPAETYN